MQAQTITLQKSRLRVVGFSMGGVVIGVLAVTSVVRCLHANGDTQLAWTMFSYALVAGVGTLASFATAMRSVGVLTVDGYQMVERIGLWFFGTSQQIDLSQVVRIEAKDSVHTAAGYTHNAKMVTRALELSTGDGTVFTLDSETYHPDQRVKLAPVIAWLMAEEKVAKVGPVEQAVAVWYAIDPTTQSIRESPLETNGIPIKAQRKRATIILICLGVFLMALFTFAGIMGTRQQSLCDSILHSHESVTAQVTQIALDKSKQYKYDSDTTTDITKASGVDLYITYEVNGKEYAKHTNIEYRNNSDVQQLYDEAQTGQINMLYPTGKPDTVRPALEFGSGVTDDKLCRDAT